MKKTGMAALSLGAAVALAVTVATPASAVTYNGSRYCGQYSGLDPRLSLNATAPGNGSWTNAQSAGQVTPFSFPGGASTRTSPYYNVLWAVTASGFYSAPTSACV